MTGFLPLRTMSERAAVHRGVPFWCHAVAATALRLLLSAAGLNTFLEGRIEVRAPVESHQHPLVSPYPTQNLHVCHADLRLVLTWSAQDCVHARYRF